MFRSLLHRFGRRRSFNASVCAYGKLPVYKDFIRKRLGSPEALKFREWLDRGVSRHWAATPECKEGPIGAHCFSLLPPGGRRSLVGVLWGSSDSGGLRSFPFSVFAPTIAQRGVQAPVWTLGPLRQLVQQTSEIRKRLSEASDHREVQSLLEEASWKVELDPRVWAPQIATDVRDRTVGWFAESIFPDDTEDSWRRLCRFLSHEEPGHGASLTVALRLPSSAGLEPVLQAAVWSRLLASREIKAPWQLLVPLDDATQGVTLLRRELLPEDIFALHQDPAWYEGLQDLRKGIPERTTEAETPALDRPLGELFGLEGVGAVPGGRG